MKARDRILAAVRAAAPPRPAAAVAAEAAALLADAGAARPALAGATLSEAFEAKAAALGTTLERVAALAEVPQALLRYLQAHGLQPSVAMQPAAEFAALDWSGIEHHDTPAPDEPVALGLAEGGIAESGSLIVHSGPRTPILLSFLALHHVVVLRAATLVPYLEDYAERLAAGAVPRNAILITGPSGTTDIEGSYVRGAHGPGFLHVIVVGQG